MRQIVKNNFRLMTALGWLLMVTACGSQSEMPETPEMPPLPIQFVAGIPAETRATDEGLQTSFTQGDNVHLSVECPTAESTDGNTDSNEHFVRLLSAQASGYANIAFAVCHHDNDTEQPLYLTAEQQRTASFYALYPDKPEVETKGEPDIDNAKPGKFNIRLSANQQNDGYAQSDYLGATQQGTTTEAAQQQQHPASVALSFRHLLSKVVFRLKTETDTESPNLSQATIELYGQPLQGTYDFNASPVFEATTTIGKATITPAGQFLQFTSDKGLVYYEGVKAIVAPQVVKSDTHLFSVFIDGVEYPYRPREDICLQSGMQQRFIITVKRGSGVSNIEVSTSINAWGDGGFTTGDAEG